MSAEAIVITRTRLRVLLMIAAKTYQELREHYGEEHARAIRIAADTALECYLGNDGNKSSDK